MPLKKWPTVIACLICCLPSQAQNIEGQIIASQFGQYQVPGIATGSLAFQPASCQVSGGGKNFVAFATGVPVKIVDANPALTEVGTPSSVNINGCSISMATTYIHTTPFYATSGTGGLQEALTNGPNKQGGPNTVILNADWYTQVAPSNPATVIAAVKGSTKLGIVDVTTVPYTVYAWNGSAYAVVSYGGGGANFPGTPGIVWNLTSSTARNATSNDLITLLGATPNLNAANLWGNPALPNGTTATTGTVGENDNKLATNAQVYATKIASIPATGGVLQTGGVAGQSVASLALPNNTTATTQSNGDNSTKVSTTAYADAAGVKFPASNGVVFRTSALASRIAVANDLNTIYGYTPLSPSYFGTLPGCGTAGNVFVPASANCLIQTTGLPTGDGMVAVTAGVGRLAVSGNDYINPFAYNGMGALGQATSSGNFSSNQFQIAGDCWTGSTRIGDFYGFQDVVTPTGSNPQSTLSVTHSGCGSGGWAFNFPISFPGGIKGTMVDAAWFGAKGDAQIAGNGCTTSTSSTTINCVATQFVDGPFATDVGKDVWVSGAGAAGVAFHSTIVSVTNSTAIVVAATPSTVVTNGQMIYGHDDVTAVQACFQYSATNAITCVLDSPTGYLIGSGGLQLVYNSIFKENSATHVLGGNMVKGSNLFCEFNGDCLSLGPGPIQGGDVSNIALEGDPSQPAGRGFHANATVSIFGAGGLFNATWTNVQSDGFALECMWLDGGGGPGYTFNLPTQIDTFINFQCTGPNQAHPANLLKITGQTAQVIFMGGQINGQGTVASGSIVANYPNPLIALEEKTAGLGDSPDDVKFIGATYEVGTKGLYVQGGTNIHYDNSYIENIGDPLITDGTANMTFNGNHIASSGNDVALAQINNTSISMRDNHEYGFSDTALCIGTGQNVVDFSNNIVGNSTTTGCATSSAFGGSSTLSVPGTSATVTTSGGPIQTISAPAVGAGKTLTLYAGGAVQFTSGGNIDFNGAGSPLNLTTGQAITFTLLDSGATWVITGVPVGVGALKGTTALATSAITTGACQTVSAGSVNSSAATGATSGSKIIWTPAASLQSVTGYQVSTSGALSIDAYPTSGFVNFNVCNFTTGSITPGALTLNWEVHP